MDALAADPAKPINSAKPSAINNPAESGSPSQFAALYNAHGDRVFRLCLRLCGGCHAEAEDLAQDALIAAFRSLPRFGGRAQITTWLYAVTLRTYQKQRARRKPETLAMQEDEGNSAILPRSLSASTDTSNAHLTRLTINAAIAALPDLLREAFVLVKVEGRTHRETAGLLSLPQGTVQARVHEAARRLRVSLQDTLRDE